MAIEIVDLPIISMAMFKFAKCKRLPELYRKTSTVIICHHYLLTIWFLHFFVGCYFPCRLFLGEQIAATESKELLEQIVGGESKICSWNKNH
jgi:hypothetical protein